MREGTTSSYLRSKNFLHQRFEHNLGMELMKTLALFVKTAAQPGDRIVHYHEFFHDFTFYAERVVDVVGRKGENPFGELELEEDATARASGRFIDEAEFRHRWAAPGRLWVVARTQDVRELFADPTFRYHLLKQTKDYYLISNQP